MAGGKSAGGKRAGYKLATYRTSEGPRAGVLIGDDVFDAAKLTGKAAYATVAGILADWKAADGAFKKAAAGAAKSRAKRLPLAKAKLMAPLQPPTIFCAGANYADHAAAMARKMGMPEPADPHEQGLKPWRGHQGRGLFEGTRVGDRACRHHWPALQGRAGGEGTQLRRGLHRVERSLGARPRPPARHRADFVFQDGLV